MIKSKFNVLLIMVALSYKCLSHNLITVKFHCTSLLLSELQNSNGISNVYLQFGRGSLASQNLYLILTITGSPILDKIYGKKQKIQPNLDKTRKFSYLFCLIFKSYSRKFILGGETV